MAFVHEVYKMVAKKLVPKRTLLKIFEDTEHLEAWMLAPVQIQKEYAEFIDNMITLRHLLTTLNVRDTV